MPKLGDAVGPSAIFQPLLPWPVNAHLKNNEMFILPSQGCFNGVSPFSCTKKSTTARVTEYKNADPECSVCISVRSCRSAASANTCNFSANAEHLVPRVRPGPLDHVQRSRVELQLS